MTDRLERPAPAAAFDPAGCATLGEVLRWRATHEGDRRAFTCLADGERDERPIDYATLDAHARAIAAALQAACGPQDRALLLFPAGTSFVAAFLGCQLANVVAVPVPAHFDDPARLGRTLPRLQAVARDAGAAVVLASPDVLAHRGLIMAHAPDLAALPWVEWTVGDGAAPATCAGEALAARAAAWRPPAVGPDDLAFLQYSSGSTGAPKGVMVAHAGLMHNSEAIRRAFGHDAGSAGVSWLPAYHDMGLVADVAQPVYAGFPMAVMSPFDFVRRPLRWLEAVARFRATTSGAPDFAYALCAAKARPEEIAALDLSAWRVAYDCAEPVRAEVLDRFAATFGPAGFRPEAFFPYLGMAEATLMVTAGARGEAPSRLAVGAAALQQGRIEPAAPGGRARTYVGLGPGLPDQRLRVVDPVTCEPCAPDAIGEVWLAGPSVARGYWRKPEETAATFGARIDDGTSAGDGPWLRTGDLGFLHAGALHLTGRLKDVVIVEGQNHFPQDLERTAEAAHAGLRPGCAAAFAVEREDGEALVIVAEVLDPAGPLAEIAATLRAAVLEDHRLAVADLVLLPPGTIPKTSSGKIQRKACKAAYLGDRLPGLGLPTAPAADAPAGETAGETAEALAALVGELLGRAGVRPADRLLDLGGRSLVATRLALRVRERFGVELPLRALFEAPSIAALAARVAALPPAAPPVVPDAGATPLSFAQARMAFLAQLDPASPLYVMPAVARLRGPLDVPRLEAAFQALVDRHAPLRTRLVADAAGDLAPMVVAVAVVRLAVTDLAGLPDPAGEAARLAEALAREPMAVDAAPLLRVDLLRLAPDHHLLVVRIHHVAADGWSMGVLTAELAAAYEAGAAALPPLALDYAAFARWQRAWLAGGEQAAQLAYWRAALAGAPARSTVPPDHPRPAAQHHRGAHHRFAVPADLLARVEALAGREGATPFMALLAAFQVVLHRHAGQADLCVGVPVANRRLPAAEALIGFFANTLVLRADLGGRPRLVDALQQARARCLDAYAHQDLPFEQLVEALNPRRDPACHPLFQAMLVLQEADMTAWRLPGLEAAAEPLAAPVAKFDLLLELQPRDGGLDARLEYDQDLYLPATAARLADHFLRVLAAIAADPLLPVADVPLPGLATPRAEVPAPVDAALTGFQGARTPTEERLAALFADVLAGLELPRVDVRASFFDLGGHSLLAARLAARIREAFGVALPLRALFEAPSVAALAAGIQALKAPAWTASLPTAPRDAAAPLSPAQARLWFMDRLAPGTALYTHPAAWRLKGTIDADALEAALRGLVARHEALRTTYAAGADGVPMQVVAPAAPFDLTRVDLRGRPDAEAEARRRAAAAAARPFDLGRAPHLRAELIAIAEADHLLVLTLHHVAVDGWSMGLLLRELAALYAAAREGRDAGLPPLEAQYLDYVAWQRAWLDGPDHAAQLAHWTARLAGAPTLLPLPTDRPRPAVESYRGARRHFRLDDGLAAEVVACARREGVTPFMLLLAAFQLLLHRYGGQDDLCVGVPFANRRLAAVEPVVGLFVNTLVLRADLAGAPTFRAFLAQVKERVLDAEAHQDLPFEKLVEALNPPRSPSHHPLYQVMFTMQDAAPGAWAEMGLEGAEEPVEQGLAKLDLSLDLIPDGAGFHGRLEYNADLFDAATMDRLVTHLEALLRGAVETPDARVVDLPILPPAERHLVVEAWNETTVAFPKDGCIHELIAAQAARTPDAVAVVFEAEALTYAALDARANRLAHHLRGLGVGPDVLVGVCLERSLDLVVGVLAILKAGGAYVPLDPTYPAERLAFLREDAGFGLLLAHAATTGRVPGAAEVLVDAADPPWRDAPPTAPASGVGLANLLSVIYTSGSTGTPKGVMNTHLGAYNHLTYRQGAYRMRPDDRIIQKTSITFDGSVWELFWPLLVGARLFVLPPAAQMDGPRLCAFIAEHGITMIDFVPSMLHEVLDAGLLEGCPTLRRFFVGGESLTFALKQQFFARLAAPALTHGYGPTETTVSVLYFDCERDDPRPTVPIGRPIANTRVYVLDPHGHPAPIGVPGELHIAGDGLARGYLGRPRLTAERFVPDPFTPGGRLYKSGDLARWLPDGHVEFLGRVDDQVKIRGFRIELGEIEAVLGAHPAVREVVVLAREDRPGEKRLVAYVVPEGGRAVAIADLRAHLKAKLPDHMVPAAFVVLDRLPLTPHEKVDRRALPAPERTRDQAEAAFVAPRTPEEAALCGLFAEVLGVPGVGVHDHFFELGGHSLLATRLTAGVRARLGVELPLRRVFEAPTPAALASDVAAARAPALPPLAPRGEAGPARLSYAQERLWFMDQLAPGRALYNIPAAYRLDGPLDVPALEAAFGLLLARHDALRTRFEAREGRPWQVVDPAAPYRLPVDDLGRHADPEAEALRLARLDAQAPFDLARGPVLRARLLRLAPDRHVLVLNLHHVVADGWSWGVLARELAGAYAAVRRGEAPDPPPLPVQYADYAAWQRGWFQGEALQAQLAYWRDQLRGAPALLRLPTDRPRPAVETYRGARTELPLAPDLRPGVEALARRLGVTPFMLLLAAFQVLLHRHSGQDDLCVGVPIANRRHEALAPLIGFFVNTLVIRADLAGAPRFVDVVAQARARCLDAYAHQDLPFEKLVEELNPARSLAHHPLFQVLFVLQDEEAAGLALEGLAATPLDLGGRLSRFDLAVELLPGADGYAARVEYNADLFDAATVARLLARFEALLRAALADPEAPVAALPLLAPGDAADLAAWAGPAVPYADDAPIHRLLGAQAAATPDAVAVVCGDRRLTYRALDDLSTRLAHRLRGSGAGPEVLVGLAADRSLELIVGFWGILKAGAAYLPLDPAYPAARLAFMAEDAGLGLVIARGDAAAGLPPGPAVVRLDDVLADLAAEPSDPLPELVGPDALAYVIYTSGSTGTPKGAELPHRGLTNLVAAARLAYGLGPGSRVLQFASPSFDASVFEIVATLGTGGTLVMGTKDDLRPGEPLDAFIRANAVTVINLPPSALAAMPPPEGPTTLQAVIVAGEACPEALATRWARVCRVYNAYGPTEATVWSTVEPFAADGAGVPIGRPIANARAHVLDGRGAPVPTGVAGELYVGGPGLARGYRGRPALTAERFVPDPFRPGERLYRTGDLVRWLPDGRLAFLGRLDHQLKVRGFRVEPGEIEGALLAHPDVREALVLARPEHAGQALTAYVVPAAAAPSEALEAERVARWRDLYDDHEAAQAGPAGEDFAGWTSSYSGEPLPRAEMEAWRADAVDRIRALGARRILEIGCGTGLLASRLAREAALYVATDFSGSAIARLARLAEEPAYAALRPLVRAADDLADLPGGPFDAVVLNSVAQYFPSEAYLRRVLAGALAALAPGGRLFVGDVRHLGQLEAFHTAVARARGATDAGAIAALARQGADQEEELCLAPGFFHALAGPGLHVEALLKRGEARNELFDFRYDVVLRRDPAEPALPVAWTPWAPGLDLAAFVAGAAAGAVGVHGVPNGRVRPDGAGVDPAAAWRLPPHAGATVRVHPGQDPTTFDLVVAPAGRLTTPLPVRAGPLANAPLRAQARAALAPALRAHLAARLPEHLVPGHLVVLDAFPLTPNGKVDRQALPAPAEARQAPAGVRLAPRTPAEAAIAEAFAEALGLPAVGVDEDFFALGGHSLLAVTLATRIRERLGVALPLRRIFEAPTVAGLAAGLPAEAPPPAPTPAGPGIPKARPGARLALSHAQAMWWTLFPRRAELEHGIQNSYALLRLAGALDAGALAGAFELVIARHEALRTTFTGFDRPAFLGLGGPSRVVHARMPFTLASGEAADEDAARARLEADAQRPFDLAAGPLLRAGVVAVGPDRHVLMVAVSHLVFDGWSMKVLLRELDAAYGALAAGRAPVLAPLPVQYSDYVAWHRRLVRREVVAKQLPYWLRQGRTMPVILELPTDRPRPAVPTMAGASVPFAVDAATTRALQALARAEGATLYMALLAAFQVLLHRHSGHTDVFVGTPVANRPRPELEGLIGLFLNFLVLRGDLAGRPSFRAYLRRVKATCLAAYAHQDLPFHVLLHAFRAFKAVTTLRAFQPERTARSNVMFNLLEDFGEGLMIGPLRATLLPLEAPFASQTLHLILTHGQAGLAGHLIYDSDLFDRETIAGLVTRYQALLASLVVDPEQPVSS